MTLTVGIDEVGYGPSLGPLVVAAVAAPGPLPSGVRIGDSKKVFSQAKGVGSLEPAVLGFLPAETYADLLALLSARLPGSPWYASPLRLPGVARLDGLAGSWARLVEADEFNACTKDCNKSDFLFEIATDLILRIRAAHPGPIRFLVGKQGGRHYYLKGLRRRISPELRLVEETPRRSAYEVGDCAIEFLMDAEERHELVALASMVGKYVRECAMKLFNEWWAGHLEGLEHTAGYGPDARRFYRQIDPVRKTLRLPREAVLRLR